MNNIQSNQQLNNSSGSGSLPTPNSTNANPSSSNSSKPQPAAPKINKTPPNHNNKNFVRNSPSMEWKIKGAAEPSASASTPPAQGAESFPVYRYAVSDLVMVL
jgi:hypothetical protein